MSVPSLPNAPMIAPGPVLQDEETRDFSSNLQTSYEICNFMCDHVILDQSKSSEDFSSSFEKTMYQIKLKISIFILINTHTHT
jgi:hypothetical protein